MFKLSTYNAMNLRSEARETAYFDEEDLSDVEDDVFIRDCKNGFRLVDDLTAKRPLMASKKRVSFGMRTKANTSGRLTYRAILRRCCFAAIALAFLIGVIAIVVICIAILPKHWPSISAWLSMPSMDRTRNAVPCNELKSELLWQRVLPCVRTRSPVRLLDINGDRIEDVIFGFTANTDVVADGASPIGAGYEECAAFLSVEPPCDVGVLALDGVDGAVVWNFWINDTVFDVLCTEDINADGLNDCLAVGASGTLTLIDAKVGVKIWQRLYTFQIVMPNYVTDQNGDLIADILMSQTTLSDKHGSIVLLSGRTGDELIRTSIPNNSPSYFMPQLLHINNTDFILYGTGSPTTSGNLSVAPLKDYLHAYLNTSFVLYQDSERGILFQPILVDITGDGIVDIVVVTVSAAKLVAINGVTFQQLWQYSTSRTDLVISAMPSPAYFNDDNVTDFLLVFDGDHGRTDDYTEGYIIDGKSGVSLYEQPIAGIVRSQLGGISVSMQKFGLDMFFIWTDVCATGAQTSSTSATSKSYQNPCLNHTKRITLNALNQYTQPPGIAVTLSSDSYQSSVPLKHSHIQSQSNVDTDNDRFSDVYTSGDDGHADDAFLRSNSYNLVNDDPFKSRTKTEMESSISDGISDSHQRYLRFQPLQQVPTSNNQLLSDGNTTTVTLWTLETKKETMQKEKSSKSRRDMKHIRMFNNDLTVPTAGAISALRTAIEPNSFDFVYVEYGSSSHKTINNRLLRNAVIRCIREKYAHTLQDGDVDADVVNQQIEFHRKQCLEEIALQFDKIPEMKFNYRQILMDETTIKRIQLKCICRELKAKEQCASVLPQNQQRWPNYLGVEGNGRINT